jgi:hypothetical protein
METHSATSEIYKGVVQDSYNYFPGMDLPDFFIGGRIEVIFFGELIS